jgi:hypothetical protein
MWMATTIAMLCAVGIEFYLRFLIALWKECRQQCHCYLIRVRSSAVERQKTEVRVAWQRRHGSDGLFCDVSPDYGCNQDGRCM